MLQGRALTFILFLSLFSTPNFAKSLAITLDDSPRFATGYFSGEQRATELLDELKRHNIPQIAFFSIGRDIEGEGKERLLKYADAGHVIAHHSNTHASYNNMSLDDFITDFELADKRISTLPNFKPWFRFPYLKEGETKEKRDGARRFLKKKGYFNAYVTLDNYDWYLESLFQRALRNKQKIDFAALEQLYIELMIESIEHYDGLAIEQLGRSPKHVLLLHEMDITALFVGNLADALRKKGWDIIPIEEAFTDEIASYEATAVFKSNPGRIGEIAYDKGKKTGLVHHSLDETYIKAKFDARVLQK